MGLISYERSTPGQTLVGNEGHSPHWKRSQVAYGGTPRLGVEHARACGGREAVFWVYERYEAPDGVGDVEAEDPLRRECV